MIEAFSLDDLLRFNKSWDLDWELDKIRGVKGSNTRRKVDKSSFYGEINSGKRRLVEWNSLVKIIKHLKASMEMSFIFIIFFRSFLSGKSVKKREQ